MLNLNKLKINFQSSIFNLQSNKGSILIWSVMLGVVLTSVFFFFGGRLQSSAATQREVIEHQNAKQYLESYVGYLKDLSPDDLDGLTSIVFDGITGELTQTASAITGFLDSGQSSPDFVIADTVTIEWNRCDLGQGGSLLLNIDPTPLGHTSNCGEGDLYDEAITVSPSGSLILTALNAPFHYDIRSNTRTPLTDTKWHLNLSYPLSFRKSIEMKEAFTAP